VILTSLGVYVVQLRLAVRPLLALAAPAALLISKFYDVWPYPNDFVIIVYLGVALAALRSSSYRGAARVGIIASMFLVFVRPELGLTLAALIAVATLDWWHAIRRRQATVIELLRDLALIAAVAGVLFFTFGNPFAGGRSFYAWGQHYAVGQVTKRHLDVNPWANWVMFVQHDFGPVWTIGDAFRANRTAFFENMLFHLQVLPDAVASTMDPLPFFPPAVCRLLRVVYGCAAACGVVALAVLLFQRGAAHRPIVIVSIFWLAITLNALVSSIFIYPRLHYLLASTAFGAVLVGAGLQSGLRTLEAALRRRPVGPRIARLFPPKWNIAAAILCGSFLLVVVPSRAYGACPQTFFGWVQPPPPENLQVLATIDAIRSLRLDRRVVVLEYGYSYALYAGLTFDRYQEWTKDRAFAALLRDSDVGLVVLNGGLDLLPAFSSDDSYHAFVENPGSFGFHTVEVHGQQAKLAVRNDL
jgi:hypothetical protein